MPNINNVILGGNLTRDPEGKTFDGGQLANFSIAINRKWKQGNDWKEAVTYVNVTAWEKQAEACMTYLHKGSPVVVEGRLESRQWTTKEGEKRTSLEVTANRVHFLERKGGGPATPPAGSSGPGLDNDDIPF